MLNLNFYFNNSINMMNMNKLNDKFNILILLIMILISYLMIFIFFNNLISKYSFNNQSIELIWTITPMLLIMLMTYYSMMILYLNNEMKLNLLNIKIIGNQWFWFYNYLNFNINFNSYMIFSNKFNFNLIETDNKLIIPINTQILLFITSMDVIHSWSIPTLNFKIDAIPNQINNNFLFINKINILYGQCSEICGINHSFMPIMIESINIYNFFFWLKNYFLSNLYKVLIF